jgi:hypothetical protein
MGVIPHGDADEWIPNELATGMRLTGAGKKARAHSRLFCKIDPFEYIHDHFLMQKRLQND